MVQLKVLACNYIKTNVDNHRYELKTDKGIISLDISKNDELRKALIDFTNCPFYLITEKEPITNISTNDYFEIANTESTIKLECISSCGVNYSN